MPESVHLRIMNESHTNMRKRVPEDDHTLPSSAGYAPQDALPIVSRRSAPLTMQPSAPAQDEDPLDLTLKTPRNSTQRAIPRSRRWQFIWEKRFTTMALLAFDGLM